MLLGAPRFFPFVKLLAVLSSDKVGTQQKIRVERALFPSQKQKLLLLHKKSLISLFQYLRNSLIFGSKIQMIQF